MLNKVKVISGEELAWQKIADADPKGLCSNADVSFNQAEYAYVIKSLGMEYKVFPKEKRIVAMSEQAQRLLDSLSYFFKLSILWYMVEAKDIGLTGRLVNPKNIRGGDIFFKGTHVLPLEGLSKRYSNDIEGFYSKAEQMGGLRTTGGDAACILYPFPRIPVTLILWSADEEFEASAELLFDSTCELQMPLDVIWSTAMLTILAMIK